MGGCWKVAVVRCRFGYGGQEETAQKMTRMGIVAKVHTLEEYIHCVSGAFVTGFHHSIYISKGI